MPDNPGARLGPDDVTVEIYGVEQGPAEAGHYVRALVMDLTIVWPASGGAVQYVQGTPTPGETLVETRLAPGDWLVTYMREGAQYETMCKVVSADGRTLRQTYTTSSKASRSRSSPSWIASRRGRATCGRWVSTSG